MKQTNEIWKDIYGHVGSYQISNLGRVKSLPRSIIRSNGMKQTFKGKLLSLNTNEFGYKTIMLYNMNKYSCYKIHRLVAGAFLLNPENKSDVNHLDGVKSNNNINNLEWATRSENHYHAFNAGLRVGQKGSENVNSVKVQKLSMDNKFIDEFDSIQDAADSVGVDRSCISRCCSGKASSSKGFKWSYKK